MRIDFKLTGSMPLLMHADDVDAADVLTEWRKDPAHKNISKSGDDRSPPWTWQTYLYSDGKHIAFPAQNLMVSLRQAGTQIVMKGRKTFKESSQSGILIDSEFLKFTVGGKQVPISKCDWRASQLEEPGVFPDQVQLAESLGFRLYTKRARIGNNKHIRVRPRFDSWGISGSLETFLPEITYEVLEQMFLIGGRGGIGDWRPACKSPGSFGLYQTDLKLQRE